MNKFFYLLFFLTASVSSMYETDNPNFNNLMLLVTAACEFEKQAAAEAENPNNLRCYEQEDGEKQEIEKLMLTRPGGYTRTYYAIGSIIEKSKNPDRLLNQLLWGEKQIPLPHFIMDCELPALFKQILKIYPEFNLNQPDNKGRTLYCMYKHAIKLERVNKERHFKMVRKKGVGICVNPECDCLELIAAREKPKTHCAKKRKRTFGKKKKVKSLHPTLPTPYTHA